MEDREIIELYFNRDGTAIEKTAEKYEGYCTAIAKNILGNFEDVKECVNDTYLNAWNCIPPNNPQNLAVYLGKITRNLCIDRYKFLTAEKRGGGQADSILYELCECISDNDVELEIDKRELSKTINEFLSTLPKKKCSIFVLRYFYAYPVFDIAKKLGTSEGSISVTLNRIRKKLKLYLEERGYNL